MARNDRLGVAVIGCGVQGRIHLDAYHDLPGVEIVACCDLDAERLEAAGRDFGIPRTFTDYGDLLNTVSVDLVSICTMPATHQAMAIACLNAGAHVLCEKPMARNTVEAEAMVAAARINRRALTIGYNMRWMGSAQFAQQFVREGHLGIPQYAHVYALANDIPWWGKHYIKATSGGGVLTSTAVHVLDLLLWVIGHPELVAVSATMLRRFPDRRGRTAPESAARAAYDVEDLLSAHIRLAGDMALTVEAAWAYDALQSRYGFELIGSQGLLQFDPLQVVAEQDDKPIDVTPTGVADTDWGRSVRREIEHVVNAIQDGRTPLVTVEQALAVQRLSDALYRSAEAGREVRL